MSLQKIREALCPHFEAPQETAPVRRDPYAHQDSNTESAPDRVIVRGVNHNIAVGLQRHICSTMTCGRSAPNWRITDIVEDKVPVILHDKMSTGRYASTPYDRLVNVIEYQIARALQRQPVIRAVGADRFSGIQRLRSRHNDRIAHNARADVRAVGAAVIGVACCPPLSGGRTGIRQSEPSKCVITIDHSLTCKARHGKKQNGQSWTKSPRYTAPPRYIHDPYTPGSADGGLVQTHTARYVLLRFQQPTPTTLI